MKIHIRSVIQHEVGQEPEVIEQALTGRFEAKENGEWSLKYKEYEGTPEEVFTSVRSFEGQITISRQGPVSYRQTYCPGKKVESIVHTPAGKTEMEVTTLSYQRRLEEAEGEIQFSFMLSMGSQDLGKYQLSLKWMEEK
ncbi:DUF1934 domain-containing protein [Laceyella putida]|uniref:DUF1934 domain-containing protein n=1 Tax=Laceyella putida TaxID=110101 RepID=A0ABW2RGN7_9BACL